MRFIPACAGNTQSPASAASAVDGSSPRVRGTPGKPTAKREDYRFIPACAGNTMPSETRRDLKPVHPRVCGEHSGWLMQAVICGGSSPRVRGTRHLAAERH